MDIKEITSDELRGFEVPRLREYETEVRTELNEIKMDIYQASSAHTGSRRLLKKNLARVLTVKNENLKKQKK